MDQGKSIELLRAEAMAIAGRAHHDDPEARAKHVARVGELDRANLASYIHYASLPPREYARLRMTPAERHADELAEAREIAASAQERIHARKEN
jgi:hypothetical protein